MRVIDFGFGESYHLMISALIKSGEDSFHFIFYALLGFGALPHLPEGSRIMHYNFSEGCPQDLVALIGL